MKAPIVYKLGGTIVLLLLIFELVVCQIQDDKVNLDNKKSKDDKRDNDALAEKLKLSEPPKSNRDKLTLQDEMQAGTTRKGEPALEGLSKTARDAQNREEMSSSSSISEETQKDSNSYMEAEDEEDEDEFEITQATVDKIIEGELKSKTKKDEGKGKIFKDDMVVRNIGGKIIITGTVAELPFDPALDEDGKEEDIKDLVDKQRSRLSEKEHPPVSDVTEEEKLGNFYYGSSVKQASSCFPWVPSWKPFLLHLNWQ